MVNSVVGGEAAQLPAISAQDGPALEPADDRDAVTPRERADLFTRAVNDDSRPFGRAAAFVEQEIGRQARAVLGADSLTGGKGTGQDDTSENEAAPRARSGSSVINNSHARHHPRKKTVTLRRSNSTATS
jgi:hypothetical protein